MTVNVATTTLDCPEALIQLIRSHDTETHERFSDFDVSVWYRGQADASHGLTPGAFRPDFLEARSYQGVITSIVSPTEFGMGFEAVFNRAFLRRAAAFLPPSVGPEEVYFLMQHHGMPTRLLDWSTNPLAALFFAVNQNHDKDGAVFLMLPNDLLNRDELPSHPLGMNHAIIQNSIQLLFGEPIDEEMGMPNIVLPVYPNLVAGRMFQQSSCFTFHLSSCKTLEDLKDVTVHKYVVPAKEKLNIQLVLRRMGIHYASIYYDLDNLAREMKAELLHPETSPSLRRPKNRTRMK